ncbi:hypothetical protein BVC80_9017g18 [Macleaya cordata]|uniref:Sororin C-terminal region domain-containing protein n=1 Tax=Macleaya cordata TaxID=56857 RepID=A0A200QQF7_MACCD|nr:hypothetical protein BVC80_9017g18 [Macleaya cordata]
MELERRNLKRKPLSDCTNITANNPRVSPIRKNPNVSFSFGKSLITKPPKPPLSTNKSDQNSFKYDTSTGSNNAENPRIRTQPSTPPRPNSSANSVEIDCENAGVATVYSRRRPVEKTRDKGKEVAETVPFSCPPARRIGSIGDKLVIEHRDVALSKSCTAVRPKSKKKRRFSLPEEPALPKDFIEKQKAYFAEIDAFELPEEVVSESELE